ncbi:hypothetical protein GWI33_006295 [Rhynchophorus ferrugineus]|uniref:Uncharacterized protein n=1 Tax=Rhynchophorus ferrugineus TaxID=354439 RepID=A0A834IF89_RHYFE|nr:hypothetical protein GWI33_006295 [Rhynchophorus ferrugineus]
MDTEQKLQDKYLHFTIQKHLHARYDIKSIIAQVGNKRSERRFPGRHSKRERQKKAAHNRDRCTPKQFYSEKNRARSAVACGGQLFPTPTEKKNEREREKEIDRQTERKSGINSREASWGAFETD